MNCKTVTELDCAFLVVLNLNFGFQIHLVSSSYLGIIITWKGAGHGKLNTKCQNNSIN